MSRWVPASYRSRSGSALSRQVNELLKSIQTCREELEQQRTRASKSSLTPNDLEINVNLLLAKKEELEHQLTQLRNEGQHTEERTKLRKTSLVLPSNPHTVLVEQSVVELWTAAYELYLIGNSSSLDDRWITWENLWKSTQNLYEQFCATVEIFYECAKKNSVPVSDTLKRHILSIFTVYSTLLWGSKKTATHEDRNTLHYRLLESPLSVLEELAPLRERLSKTD
jgi:hypothetical protein